MKLRSVLVDDEPLALRRLEIALKRIPQVEILGKARDAEDARELIGSMEPDLLFVDVQMPGQSGLELIDSLGAAQLPGVILVTAYDRFAIDAFEKGAIGYVLKPIDEGKLLSAVERAQTVRQNIDQEKRIENLQNVIQTLKEKVSERKTDMGGEDLWISHHGASVRLPLNEVRYFEAAGDYVEIVTKASRFLHHDSLRSLEERLDQERFIRVHRSAIVALPFVSSYERARYGSLILSMDDGAQIRCSRSRATAIRKCLETSGL